MKNKKLRQSRIEYLNKKIKLNNYYAELETDPLLIEMYRDSTTNAQNEIKTLEAK